jgi:cell division protease FtsH
VRNQSDYGGEIAREIDDEIRRIVESAHRRATDILLEHRRVLEAGSAELLRRETLERDEFLELFDFPSSDGETDTRIATVTG